MNVKLGGNRTYAIGTVVSVLGGLGLVLPDNIGSVPLPTTIEGACALLLTVMGLGFVTLRLAIRDALKTLTPDLTPVPDPGAGPPAG